MTITTHDLIAQRVTIEAPINQVGDTQIYNGEEWIFDGRKWFRAAEVEQSENG